MTLRRLFIIIIGCLVVLIASGQQRVGLVLSGGGARGIAHAGFIKALEENDVAIDYVTGTSMGAIVAALYACGYTPDEMLELFTSEGFKHWSSGVIDQKDLFYLAKPDPTPQWLQVNLSFRDSVKFQPTFMPGSLISPLPMNIEFVRLFSPYSQQCRENFDNLFVPFRCVTSDIYHKHKIVCRDGSLADAVRASMSFPMVFKPIEMDGVLVYDGGIYDNFPVDVMREDFHPDIMIGNSVSLPDGKPIQGDLYSQLEDMIIQNNDYSLPAEEGIKVQQPVKQFQVLQWGAAQEIFDIGYKTGIEMIDSIKSRVTSRRSLADVNARRKTFRSNTPALEFDNIEITGATPSQSKYITYNFNPERKRVINMDDAEKGYYRVISENKLIDLVPQAEPHFTKPDSAFSGSTLKLKATVKDRFSLGVGGWLTTSTQSMLYAALGYRTLSFNSLDASVAGWLGQSYCAGEAKLRFHLRTSRPSYVQLQGVLSHAKRYETEMLFFQDSDYKYATEIERFVRLRYAIATGWNSLVAIDAAYGSHDVKYDNGLEQVDNRDRVNNTMWQLRLGYESNTLNNQLYPSAGHEMLVRISGMRNKAEFLPADVSQMTADLGSHWEGRLQMKWRGYFGLSSSWRLGIEAGGHADFSKLYLPRTATLAMSPEFAPFPSVQGYFNEGFRAPAAIWAGVMPIWNPMTNLQFRGDFVVFQPVRSLKGTGPMQTAQYGNWFSKTRFMGEIAAVYNFPFASVCLYVNYLSTPARNWNFGINLGHYFQAPSLL